MGEIGAKCGDINSRQNEQRSTLCGLSPLRRIDSGLFFQLISLLKIAHSITIFPCCNIVIDYIHNMLLQGPHHLYRVLSMFRLYGLDSPEGNNCVGDWPPDHKGGRCIQSHLCHFDLKKVTFFHFALEQSHMCHFDLRKSPLSFCILEKTTYKQRRSKFDLTDIQILSSEKLTSETSDMQVESHTSDKGTWNKMAVMIGLDCMGSLFFAKLLRSFQRKSVCKAKNAITMVPD